MWHAIPVSDVDESLSALGPDVGAPQPGNEHRYPALFANKERVSGLKSPLRLLMTYNVEVSGRRSAKRGGNHKRSLWRSA